LAVLEDIALITLTFIKSKLKLWDTMGFETGLVATKLIKKVAISSSVSF
jgi:hypothetical protein